MPVELGALTAHDWETWRSIRLEALARAPYAFGSRHADWASASEERWRARLTREGSHNLVAFAGTATVGDALVVAVEDWARGRGATWLCLGVVATNTPARRLYERHGLVVTGEADRGSVDAPRELRMCKQLARPAER